MPALPQRAFCEWLGTAFLLAAVVGSGIMASRLSDDVGLQLLENAAATAAALIGLILMFGAVSGAHFNPVVTLVERGFGAISTRTAATLIAAQVVGGILGAVLANLMFGLAAVSISTHDRSSPGLWLGEVVATLGLVLVIFGTMRSGLGQSGLAVLRIDALRDVLSCGEATLTARVPAWMSLPESVA